MTRPAPDDAWERFRSAVEGSSHPPLPRSAPFQGSIVGAQNYAPPEHVLERLKDWLRATGATQVLYFPTESVAGRDADLDHEIDLWDLTSDTIVEIADGLEGVITGADFSWAIYTCEDGTIHVGGSSSFFSTLKAPGHDGYP